jgi:MSHA biogenesis protein MshQ
VWEVEKYNGTTGNLIAWVKILSSAMTDTLFYLFYGNPSITTDQSDPVNTWDSNFKAVYHLGNGTTLSTPIRPVATMGR